MSQSQGENHPIAFLSKSVKYDDDTYWLARYEGFSPLHDQLLKEEELGLEFDDARLPDIEQMVLEEAAAKAELARAKGKQPKVKDKGGKRQKLQKVSR
jgi:hypothetical protein